MLQMMMLPDRDRFLEIVDHSRGSVLLRLPHGAKVVVLVPGDGWVKVRYNGYTGYAMSYFLQ